VFIECAVNDVVKHYVCLAWLSPSGSKPAAPGAIKRRTWKTTEISRMVIEKSLANKSGAVMNYSGYFWIMSWSESNPSWFVPLLH